MNREQIKQALESLGVPVKMHQYNGEATTYITFAPYNEQTGISADNKELGTFYFWQVNIYSDANFDELIKKAKEVIGAIGGWRQNESETFDLDGIYQRSIRFKFSVIH